eukprot:3648666-Amphidinium_carterae.2
MKTVMTNSNSSARQALKVLGVPQGQIQQPKHPSQRKRFPMPPPGKSPHPVNPAEIKSIKNASPKSQIVQKGVHIQ